MYKYVFLTYRNRSGSTLLASMLNNFPDICSTPEAEILSKLLLIGNAKDPVSNQTIKLIEKAMASDPKLSFWNLKLSDLDIKFEINPSKEASFIDLRITSFSPFISGESTNYRMIGLGIEQGIFVVS